MKKFIASRLSEGNKLFPAEIIINDGGLEVKIPGFFSDESKFIGYDSISAVEIDSPMIGFSTLAFFHNGNKVIAHGFTKTDAKKIKEEIDKGKTRQK
jgi:hypothetical protein